MTSTWELRNLKTELASFESLNLEELKQYTGRISRHISQICATHPTGDAFFNQYIEEVIMRHVQIIEDFINSLETNFQGREAFVTRSLKYHYNCIIDSYTYALLVLQHN